ncbi:hypothetical protein ANN_01426 [Periplaneta americana]|uniref:Chitin-binding type-2 domain-containing protein n=1 Tax=Periplaneta americana TaxID=6978 RepID=A0ABQ8TWX3_PERAM|nr:hypothetical protein ANN_01426 [Periplaneta americana]
MTRVQSPDCNSTGFLVACAAAQRRPPNYSLDDMPDTNFNCRDKILGGYYADPETDCQMFHVCVKVPGVGVQDFRFLCPNETSFDQENQICANWFDIDCEAATLYYSDNFDLYRIAVSTRVWCSEGSELQVLYELKRASPKVNVCCVVSRYNLYGPFIFAEETVRSGPYLDMSPNSPDLTPLDFFLWSFVKNDMYDLRAKIVSVFEKVTLKCHVPSSPNLGTSNATPIPLGPSTARPPLKTSAVSKPRPRYQNNRPSDEEEDYFLQRSETGDRRLQQKDLLRYIITTPFRL